MMNQKTEVWKQASEVYENISELSVQQALAHVYGIKNISQEVQKALITLINSGNQASLFYQENIANKINLNFNSNVQIGQKLGEYELLEVLGQGGMSQVFKAKRAESEPQKMVAIKVFSPRDNSIELLNHFINEQKILSQFSHPNIIDMLHGGKTENDTVYLVMELINKALPISTYCKKHKCTTKQKIEFIAQCADALSYSHANLIIHRDLKPENILIGNDDKLKIVDFGIAKLINNEISGNKTTIMALTPNYAAPEQINSEKITVKTDVFSLAVVALDLLIDEAPLPKNRLLKSCADDEHHIDIVLRNLKIDKDLKNIIHKAISQNPDNRYSSMQIFFDDLNNWLTHKPVYATSQSLHYKIRKFAQRRSALFATIVSFVFFLIITSIVSYLQYQQIKIEAEKADFVKQFMLDSFQSTNPDLARGVEVSAKDLLKASAEKLNEETQLDSQIRFELLQTLGIAYGAIGVPEKAVELLKKSLTIQPDNSTSLSFLAIHLFDYADAKTHKEFLDNIHLENFTSNRDKARVLRVKAKVNAKKSEMKAALFNLNKALELNKLEKDSIEEILSMRLLAEFYYLQSEPNKGINILKSSLQQVNSKTPLTLILGLKSDLGTLYNDIGEYDLALIELQQSVEQIRDVLGDKNLELSKVLGQISGTYRYLGQMDKAQKAANESHLINMDVFGENNINTATSLNMLAVMSYQTGNIPTAIEQMRRAIEIFEVKQSDKYSDTLELKTNLAALLSISDRDEEALILLKEIYTKQMSTLGAKHDSTIYSQQIMARTLAKLDHIAEAIELAENAAQNAKQYLGMKNPLTSGALFTLAGIYQQDNQTQKALGLYIDIKKNKLIKPNNPKYPILLKSIAKLYADSKDVEKALNYYKLSIQHYSKLYSSKHLKTLNTQLDFAQYLKNTNQLNEYFKIIKQVKKIIIDEKIDNPEFLLKLKDLK